MRKQSDVIYEKVVIPEPLMFLAPFSLRHYEVKEAKRMFNTSVNYIAERMDLAVEYCVDDKTDGLEPPLSYEAICKYVYYTEDGKEIDEETFWELPMKTKKEYALKTVNWYRSLIDKIRKPTNKEIKQLPLSEYNFEIKIV